MIAQVEPHVSESELSVFRDLEGMVQIFTAPHRSFFTNVVAQAIRTSAQGRSTLLVQFLKGGIGTGPDYPVQLCQNLTWVRCNLERCINPGSVTVEEQSAIQSLWAYTQTAIFSDQYDMVILDEVSLAIQMQFISESEFLEVLSQRPRRLDLVLTGPSMPQAVLDSADQVTELRRSLYI